MAYVRINMVEFDSEEDLKRDAEVLNSNAGNLFPELLLIAGVQTTETSSLSITVHPNKEAADRAKSLRDDHMAEVKGLSLTMSHEGDLSIFYQKPEAAFEIE